MARVYESRTNRALVHNYFIARKYCVLSRYAANNYINVFPANTFFNDAYQTISDIQFIATGQVAPVTGYKYIYIYMCVQKKIVIERTRDLNYLKFVATDFSPKTISPSAGENSGDLA